MQSFKRKDRLAALKAKRSQPSPLAAKLQGFVRGQMSVGVSLTRAFELAKKLDMGGRADAR